MRWLIILVLGAILVAVLYAPDAAHAAPGHRANPPVITLSGPPTSGTTLGIGVGGVPAPLPGGEEPAFIITVKFNGWDLDTGEPEWDSESGAWRLDYDIPPGQSGATITITVSGSSPPVTVSRVCTVL